MFAVLSLLMLLTPARALATTPPTGGASSADGATTTTIDNAFLDTKRQLSECLNKSVDLPDCGIEPKQSGDRGGALQGVTFGVLTLGIVIISWRVVRSIKARDSSVGSRPA